VLVVLTSGLTLFSRRPEPIAQQNPAASGSGATPLPFEEARRIVIGLGRDVPPAPREAIASGERAWHDWLDAHDEVVRARVDLGNEDSLYYFWLYGTSFSTRPRATRETLGSLSQSHADTLVDERLNDLLAGLEHPGGNSRLTFGRAVLERRGIAVSTPEGRERARAFLLTVRRRVIAENRQLARVSAAASAIADDADRDAIFGTMLRERGLSSDTSLVVNFSVMGAFRRLKDARLAAAQPFRRIAVIGPGLDFTDKADGYDFYPEQSMQPFAVVDALQQLDLAAPGSLEVVTLDLNPRINQHLDDARQRAVEGDPYVLHLPFDRASYHNPRAEFVRYWEAAGAAIGDVVTSVAAPPDLGGVAVRAVAVRADVVRSVMPRDLNIVTSRLAGADFDLIVATNVLVYYDRFEQALALANIAAMLRTGGLFLANSPVTSPADLRSRPDLSGPIPIDDDNADQMFWFERTAR
jgi:hypothetical protein